MSKEAMKLALEAFEDRPSLMKWQKARDAVKEALAKQEQEQRNVSEQLGEPVDYKEQARKGCGSCSYQYCDYPDCVKRETK